MCQRVGLQAGVISKWNWDKRNFIILQKEKELQECSASAFGVVSQELIETEKSEKRIFRVFRVQRN